MKFDLKNYSIKKLKKNLENMNQRNMDYVEIDDIGTWIFDGCVGQREGYPPPKLIKIFKKEIEDILNATKKNR